MGDLTWNILIVDNEPEIYTVMKQVLGREKILGRSLNDAQDTSPDALLMLKAKIQIFHRTVGIRPIDQHPLLPSHPKRHD